MAKRAWQRMLSGRRLDLLDPTPLDIEIEDIAHGLSFLTRWNGQTSGINGFSVAEHSLLVEHIFSITNPNTEPKWKMAALLHDAAEYVNFHSEVVFLLTPNKVYVKKNAEANESYKTWGVTLKVICVDCIPGAVNEPMQLADNPFLSDDEDDEVVTEKKVAVKKLAEPDVTEEEEEEDAEEEEVVEEEEDAEEGIEIAVSLPRKKVKSLMILSGGERALTSIALLFAMSQVKPPPFIILDETDAALDEANSRKYGDMIENLSKHSQLILITHNRETMSRAGILYGVTMGSGGISKLLSVALEDAVAVAK